METNNKLGEYTFKVLPFEVDFREKLTLPHLTNYILNSAGYHSESLGFGIQKINKESNKSWVLSRLAIEMVQYPKNYDKIQVQTWVEGVMRTFSFRNFAFLSKEGEVLGYARSIWAMIDITTRKPTNMTDIILPEFFNKEKECPIAKSGKIPAIDVDALETFKVKYSDIDFNQHLNSAKYIEHIIDSFTLYKFSKRDIKRFEVDFIAESTFGETISIHKKESENNDFLVELRNENNETICPSKISFSDKILHNDYNINRVRE